MVPEPSVEVLKARTAQALRAFLCLQPSETIRLNPEIIGTRIGTRYNVYQKRVPIMDGNQSWRG